MQVDQEKLDELVRRIREVVEPLRIILFGSAARGDARPDSDIDVLVVIPEGRRRLDVGQEIYRNLIGFRMAVDVIVATEDDLRKHGDDFSLVYYPALREGRDLYAA